MDCGKKPALVVVAADASGFSEAALRRAAALFAGEDTCFHLVHVRPPDETLSLEVFSDAVHGRALLAEERREQQSRRVLARFRALCLELKVPHATTVEMRGRAVRGALALPGALGADAREELCRYCDEVGADVLVLGSRGTGSVSRALLGSMSSYCAHHAPCAVMVHREGATTATKDQ